MSNPTKRGAGGKLAPTSAEAIAKASVKDPKQARLLRMGQALGNDELQRRIDQGNATRDEMLVYMTQRLSAMREAQVREEQYGDHRMRETWIAMANIHKPQFSQPEPMRWIEAAKGYETAARVLCQGHMSRAAELMKQAMEAEKHAFERVGKQIGVDDLKPEAKGPEKLLDDVKSGEACAPRDVPADLEKLADKIQANTTDFPDLPVKARGKDPWWTEEEEEEDEKPPGGAAGGGGGGAG